MIIAATGYEISLFFSNVNMFYKDN